MSIWCIGISSNDLPICLICLLALYIFLKYLWREDSQKRNLLILFSGFLFGASAGLKYVSIYFFIGIICSLILFFIFKEINKPLKIFSFFILGFIIGFSITGAWWCILLWKKFGNPFFPKLNHIFQSPFALPISYADTRHFPEKTIQYIFYPFYCVFQSDRLWGFEHIHRDFRQVFLYISCLFLTGCSIAKKIKPALFQKTDEIDGLKKIFFLNYMLLFTYIIWINTTCYLRYIVFLELLCGIYIISTILIFLKPFSIKVKKSAVILLILFLAFTTRYCFPGEYRIEYHGTYLDPPDLNLPDDSIVLQLGGWPSAFFIPFNNPKARWIYLYGELWDFNFKYPESEEKRIKEIINRHKGKVYLIYSIFEPAIVPWEYIEKFINKNEYTCREIKQNNYRTDYYFCSPNIPASPDGEGQNNAK